MTLRNQVGQVAARYLQTSGTRRHPPPRGTPCQWVVNDGIKTRRLSPCGYRGKVIETKDKPCCKDKEGEKRIQREERFPCSHENSPDGNGSAWSAACQTCRFATPTAGDEGPRPTFLVSVIIASRQEGSEIRETVQSAADAATGPLEIIVVDDGSTDGSCDGLTELSRPGVAVHVVRAERSLGAGRARNVGFGMAVGRVLVSCDAHMRFPRGIWHTIGRFALDRQAITCPSISSMFGGVQGTGADLCYHREGKIGMNYHRAKGEDPEPITNPIGACYFIPREIYEALGRYPAVSGVWGYEEVALGTWAWLHAVPCYTYPAYTVHHLYRSESNKDAPGVPWGEPPTPDLWLNIGEAHLALFDPETYQGVWQQYIEPRLTPEGRATLKRIRDGDSLDSGYWRTNKQRTDRQFFRDVLRVPALPGKRGAVKAVRPISAIFTGRDEGKETGRTITSVVSNSAMPFEVVLVDDGSRDGSVGGDFYDEIRKHVAKHWRGSLEQRVKIIRHAAPQGVTRSRHEAIAAASGDVFFIGDCHERVITRYGIEELCTWAQELSPVILVAAVCNIGASKKEARTYGAQMIVKPKWGLYNRHVASRPPASEMLEGRLVKRNAIIGAAYALTRETLDAIGGWPRFPGYWAYNEQWLDLECWFRGVPMYCLTDVTIEHLYKKVMNYECPHVGTLLNAHYTHYVHFDDEAYEVFWKPVLAQHGWDPAIEVMLGSAAVQEKRAAFQAVKQENGKDDEAFFRDVLGCGINEAWEKFIGEPAAERAEQMEEALTDG